jgi:hypothetical protein
MKIQTTLAIGCLCAATLSPALIAQRPIAVSNVSAFATKPAIDDFVRAVRDMAAWAIVTPSAHIPVGGIQDSAGPVESVVTPQNGPAASLDSTLAAFRRTLGTLARTRRLTTVGLAYLVRRVVPGVRDSVDAVLVEVEHNTGERADVLFPYTRNEFGEPVFDRSYPLAGTLRVLTFKRSRR